MVQPATVVITPLASDYHPLTRGIVLCFLLLLFIVIIVMLIIAICIATILSMKRHDPGGMMVKTIAMK